jgi:hypothetical protein
MAPDTERAAGWGKMMYYFADFFGASLTPE